jgi:hypothetical protein
MVMHLYFGRVFSYVLPLYGATACFLLAGCNGVHFHSDADQALAKDAHTAFTDAKLSNSVADERKVLDELLQRELAVVRRNTIARRDVHVLRFVDSSTAENSWGKLSGEINARRELLIGKVEQQQLIAAIINFQTDKSFAESTADSYNIELHKPGGKGPELAWPVPKGIGELNGEFSAGLKLYFDEWKKSRQRYEDDVSTINGFSLAGTEFGGLNADLTRIEKAQEDIRTAMAVLNQNYQNVKKDYENATQASESDLIARATILKDRLDKLAEPIHAIGENDAVLDKLGLGGLRLTGLLSKLEEQQASIEAIIDAFTRDKGQPDARAATSGAATTGKDKVLLQIASQLPSLYAEIGNALKYPRINSLLLESEHLRLQAEHARRRVETANQQIRILQLKRDAISQELLSLVYAGQSMGEFVKGFAVVTKGIEESAAAAADTAKRTADDATVRANNLADPTEKSKALDVIGKQKAASLAAIDKDKNDNLLNYSLMKVFNQGTPELREYLTRALLGYANSWTLGRVAEEEADYLFIATQHSAALDSSEIALAQWENLIGVPLAQLEAYHTSGVTSQDLGNLIQAFGFASIGIGTNK